MCMVSLVPEMVQAYASTNAVSEDAGIRAEYNGDSGVLTLDVSTNKAMIDFGLEDKKPWTNFNVISKDCGDWMWRLWRRDPEGIYN